MSTRPLPAYRIVRDLVKEGYQFRLMLYNAEVATCKTPLPFPPAWMIDRRENGNVAAQIATTTQPTATTSPSARISASATSEATKGECHAAG